MPLDDVGPSEHRSELAAQEASERAPPEGAPPEQLPAIRERLGILGNRRLLGTLIAGGLMLTIGLTAIVNSAAYYTVQSTDPDNAFGADEVDIDVAEPGQIIVGANFAPGEARSGTQTITSLGHRCRITLDATHLTGGALLDVLTVTVRETSPGSAVRYQGPLRNLRGADLGELGAAQAKSFQVTVTWPADRTDPGLPGTTVSFDFVWAAESVP